MAYILTFIVLEKYRKLKIGSEMILEMERSLREEKTNETKPPNTNKKD